MSQLFWLRGETKANEFRRAITPNDCKDIITNGHKVTVEDWKDSIIPISQYIEAGCGVAPEYSWSTDAPTNAIIIGLKELDPNIKEFKHTHIYFAHAFKGQNEAEMILSKFKKGGGKLIDLEYMVDENKRRVCAFGYWAGYVGAALGAVFTNKEQTSEISTALQKKERFSDKDELISFVKSFVPEKKKAIVIGALGRVGTGARDFINTLKWDVTPWDRIETQVGGPFKEIMDYQLFVNCVLSTGKTEPFLTTDLIINNNNKLEIISDVTCDPDSECNVLPIYKEATRIENPLTTVSEKVSLIAFDNFPSILPKESSFDFSSQFSPFIKTYNEDNGPLRSALDIFKSFL
jgi:saccharopine dehydrogenase (NAD+, L-lysine-forming)